MKKSLIFIAMLAFATTPFAENEAMSCESELGKCTYTVSDEYFTRECYCRDGREKISDPEEIGNMPKNEECELELADICSESGFICENNAGECHLEANGEYYCYCIGRETQRGKDENVSAEGCTAVLEKECGTELPTLRSICANDELLNECASYSKTFNNTCRTPVTDEEFDAKLDRPLKTYGETDKEIVQCCSDNAQKAKETYECLGAFENCEENKENCCASCHVVSIVEGGAGDGDGDVISPAPEDEDAANTEAPTTGTTTEDTADGDSAAPATDSEAPAENKEESKSDGCSMMFI